MQIEAKTICAAAIAASALLVSSCGGGVEEVAIHELALDADYALMTATTNPGEVGVVREAGSLASTDELNELNAKI